MGSLKDLVGSLNFAADTLNYIASVGDGYDDIDCYSNRMMIIFNYTFGIRLIEVTSICLKFEFCDTLNFRIRDPRLVNLLNFYPRDFFYVTYGETA